MGAMLLAGCRIAGRRPVGCRDHRKQSGSVSATTGAQARVEEAPHQVNGVIGVGSGSCSRPGRSTWRAAVSARGCGSTTARPRTTWSARSPSSGRSGLDRTSVSSVIYSRRASRDRPRFLMWWCTGARLMLDVVPLRSGPVDCAPRVPSPRCRRCSGAGQWRRTWRGGGACAPAMRSRGWTRRRRRMRCAAHSTSILWATGPMMRASSSCFPRMRDVTARP